MLDKKEFEYLKKKAQKIRISIIQMVAQAQSGHPGGSLSATDIVTTLYFKSMHYDAKNPN